MLRFAITITIISLILSGCITTSEFYSPVVKKSERLSVGSCGNRFESFNRKLDEGVYLEIFDQSIIFRVKKGAAIRFVSQDVKFLNIKNNEVMVVKISEITTGTFPLEIENRLYALKPMKFKPLDEFLSTGQYRNIELQWGEWSPWKSKADVFRVALSEYPKIEPKEKYSIELPSFYVNGLLTKVEPIVFTWKMKNALMCFQ